MYEVVTDGRHPLAFEVSGNGDFVYVEEELAPRSLPEPVLARVSRVYPGVEIAYATREFRRSSGPDVVYEVYLRHGAKIREVEFEASGQPHGTEEQVF